MGSSSRNLVLVAWFAGTACITCAFQGYSSPFARPAPLFDSRSSTGSRLLHLPSRSTTIPPCSSTSSTSLQATTTKKDEDISKAGKRFDSMLDNFRTHSASDINLVASVRIRGLLRGVAAGINDEKVTRAFRVLYEDLGPVRVAGDLVFSKMEREVSKSKASDSALAVGALGRDDSCVVSARKIFDAVDADASGTVSSKELLDSDLLRSLGQCADCSCDKKGSCQSVTRFMDEIEKTHPEGELHFGEFLVAAHQLVYQGDASVSLFGGEECAEDLVDELLNGREGDISQEKADRYSKRFDGMIVEFDSWDSTDSMSKAQSSNPRLASVLEGCFAGSKQPQVVEALKILYMDFLPLRMAGDLIFKMMRKLAN